MRGQDSSTAGAGPSAAAAFDVPAQAFYDHSAGARINTDAVMNQVISSIYPDQSVTITNEGNTNLLAYAMAGHATHEILETEQDFKTPALIWRNYSSPPSRLDGEDGKVVDRYFLVKFAYKWKGTTLLVYLAEGRDGSNPYPPVRNYYIIGDRAVAEDLIFTIGKYDSQLHGEIWVFVGGNWQKDAALWQSVQKAKWENVILDDKMKKVLIDDTNLFFDSRETYQSLGIPWKRGLIFYGPPGNGKTISIKATMHMLEQRKLSVRTLYVRSLASYMGPEMALKMIFERARAQAPAYLVFEDLDSMITPDVRSFFFNELDGLAANDGIMIIGSTNHLDQLDPGIAKRPSRFDRKFLFPDPDEEQRTKYAEFWQRKLKDNKDLDFPDELCPAIASITDGFSFAYIQEAFVAALLALATREKSTERNNSPHGEKDLDEYPLWREMKHQVKILREEMGNDQKAAAEKKAAGPAIRPRRIMA